MTQGAVKKKKETLETMYFTCFIISKSCLEPEEILSQSNN